MAKAKDKERLSKKPYQRMSVGEAGSALGRKTARTDRGQGLEARRRLEQHVESAISSKVAAEEKRSAGLTEAQKVAERKEYAQKFAPRRAASAAQRRDRLSISPFPRPAGKPTVKPKRRAEGPAPTPTGRPTVRVAGKTLARDQKKRRDFEAGHTIGRGVPGYGSSARRRDGDAEGHAGGAPGAQGQTPTKIKLTEKERFIAPAGREAESASLARSGPGREKALRYAMGQRMEERRGIHRPGEKPGATETELRRTSALGKLTYQEQLDKDRAAAKEARTKARGEKGAEFEETREKTLEKEKLEAEERVRKHQIETQAKKDEPPDMTTWTKGQLITSGTPAAQKILEDRETAERKAAAEKKRQQEIEDKAAYEAAAVKRRIEAERLRRERARIEAEKWKRGEPGAKEPPSSLPPEEPKGPVAEHEEATARGEHGPRARSRMWAAYAAGGGRGRREKERSTAWAKQKLSKEWKAAQESAKRHGKRALKTRGK